MLRSRLVEVPSRWRAVEHAGRGRICAHDHPTLEDATGCARGLGWAGVVEAVRFPVQAGDEFCFYPRGEL